VYDYDTNNTRQDGYMLPSCARFFPVPSLAAIPLPLFPLQASYQHELASCAPSQLRSCSVSTIIPRSDYQILSICIYIRRSATANRTAGAAGLRGCVTQVSCSPVRQIALLSRRTRRRYAGWHVQIYSAPPVAAPNSSMSSYVGAARRLITFPSVRDSQERAAHGENSHRRIQFH